jgi:hypothetical protein
MCASLGLIDELEEKVWIKSLDYQASDSKILLMIYEEKFLLLETIERFVPLQNQGLKKREGCATLLSICSGTRQPQ